MKNKWLKLFIVWYVRDTGCSGMIEGACECRDCMVLLRQLRRDGEWDPWRDPALTWFARSSKFSG